MLFWALIAFFYPSSNLALAIYPPENTHHFLLRGLISLQKLSMSHSPPKLTSTSLDKKLFHSASMKA